MKKILVPLSSSLEYIIITDDSKFYGYYHMKLKFKEKKKLYDYEVKKDLWENYLEKEAINSNGLNIGKTIWCYIVIGDIIEHTTYKQIMDDIN